MLNFTLLEWKFCTPRFRGKKVISDREAKLINAKKTMGEERQ